MYIHSNCQLSSTLFSTEHLDTKSGFIPTSVEGDTLRYPCFKKVNVSRFFFCKGECKKEEDILIETDQKSLQRGRYSIEYMEGSAFGLYVTIAQVTKSDIGQYKCGYGRALSTDSSPITFPVIVIDGEFYLYLMFNVKICFHILFNARSF